MNYLVSIGRWLGMIIGLSLGAAAMFICLIASVLQALAKSIINLTEEEVRE